MQSESAVVSITFEPRSIASRWVIAGRNLASGLVRGSPSKTPCHPVLGHQDPLGVDLERAQRRGGVGREVRVAGSGREDHDPSLLEMADRATADVRLGDLADVERGEHPRVGAVSLERLLDRERVEHGREHPHVVAGRAVHPGRSRLHAAVDVPAADDERELDSRARAPRRARAPASSTVAGSRPNSVVPISASPESFSRTRRNAGAGSERGRGATAIS